MSFQATKSNSSFTFIYDNVIKTRIKVIHIQNSKKNLSVQSRQKNAKITVRKGLS